MYTRKANLARHAVAADPAAAGARGSRSARWRSRRAGATRSAPQVRPTLQVLANQLAVALANADSVRRLEELATTDGLTGCFNKRFFDEQLQAPS